MGPRTVTGLAVVTAVTVAAAAYGLWSQPGAGTVRLANEPLFPALRSHPETVAAIEVSFRETTFRIRRTEAGTWVVADKHDFPAAADKVRELVSGLAEMQLVEAKTARADRFSRLQVEDVGTDKAESRRVRVTGAGDQVLAEVLLGKRHYGFTGGQEAGTYVRRPGETLAWLASGGVNVATDVAQWLDRDVIDIPADQIRRVEISGKDRPTLVAARARAEESLVLESVPDGKAAKGDEVRRLASALVNIDLDDVAPAVSRPIPQEAGTFQATTFDGLAVTARVWTADNDRWAVFSAGAGENAVAEGSDAGSRAKALNDRLAGWAFKIPGFAADRLLPSVESLLEPARTSGPS